MKIIKYIYHVPVNEGTEQHPKMADRFYPVEIKCDTEESLNANIELAKKEAYNGEYTIEEVAKEDI